MTGTLAGSLAALVLVLAGLAGLGGSLRSYAHDHDPQAWRPTLGPARLTVAALAALAVVGGAYLLGAVTT